MCVRVGGGGSGRPPLEKYPKMELGSNSDNSQLNNSVTHSNFVSLHLSGKISKNDTLEKFDPPWKNSLIFALNVTRSTPGFPASAQLSIDKNRGMEGAIFADW